MLVPEHTFSLPLGTGLNLARPWNDHSSFFSSRKLSLHTSHTVKPSLSSLYQEDPASSSHLSAKRIQSRIEAVARSSSLDSPKPPPTRSCSSLDRSSRGVQTSPPARTPATFAVLLRGNIASIGKSSSTCAPSFSHDSRQGHSRLASLLPPLRRPAHEVHSSIILQILITTHFRLYNAWLVLVALSHRPRYTHSAQLPPFRSGRRILNTTLNQQLNYSLDSIIFKKQLLLFNSQP